MVDIGSFSVCLGTRPAPPTRLTPAIPAQLPPDIPGYLGTVGRLSCSETGPADNGLTRVGRPEIDGMDRGTYFFN